MEDQLPRWVAYLSALSTVGAALAAMAAAYFAYTEGKRANRAEKARQKAEERAEVLKRDAVDQRVSQYAYELQHALAHWLSIQPREPGSAEELEDWVARVMKDLPVVDGYMSRIADLAVDASDDLSEGARTALVIVKRISGWLHESARVFPEDKPEGMEAAVQAIEEIEACLSSLMALLDMRLMAEHVRHVHEASGRPRPPYHDDHSRWPE